MNKATHPPYFPSPFIHMFHSPSYQTRPKAMEATLCLRSLHTPTPANKLHSLLFLHNRGLTVPTPSSIAVRSAPGRTSHLLIRASAPADTGNSRAISLTRPAAVGAAVVLACFLGVMSSDLRRGGLAHAKHFGWVNPTVLQHRFSTGHEKQIEELWKIVQKRNRDGVEKLLKEQLGDKLNKKYPNLLKEWVKSSDEEQLLKEWNKKNNHEKYMLGLLLMDIFMHKGGKENLKKADNICMEMEKIAPPSDILFQLHKAIIKMLEVDDILSTNIQGLTFIKDGNKIKHLKKMILKLMVDMISMQM